MNIQLTVDVNTAQKQIREFMVKADQETPDRPTMPGAEIRKLRAKLIAEELIELSWALGIEIIIDETGIKVEQDERSSLDLVQAADGIADLLYVVIGTAVALGIDIEPVFQEVHRSNMSKFIDGHRRADGKWVKGPSYSPANLKPILEEQAK